MPHTVEARKLMERQALELRARAERFRTFAQGSHTGACQTLLELAQESDDFASRIEARLKTIGAPSSLAVAEVGPSIARSS